MARSKLTDRDREQLVELYRNTDVTLQGLAARFAVSHSTASRIVKEGIPTDEYQALVKAKRSGGERKSAKPPRPVKPSEATQTSLLETPPLADADGSAEEEMEPAVQAPDSFSPVKIPESKLEAPEAEGPTDSAWDDTDAEDAETGDRDADDFDDFDDEFDTDPSEEEASIAAELMDDDDTEDEDDIEATLDDDDESDDELDDESDDESDDEDGDYDPDEDAQTVDISVRDLEDLELPQRIYAVVDRFQELSAAPLSDFKHLGSSPDELAAANTLPLFDEHRGARRF
ncbi:MAG: hypothetical protein AAFY15_05475, partial [Cyanobacteria bacterium J06648_11]